MASDRANRNRRSRRPKAPSVRAESGPVPYKAVLEAALDPVITIDSAGIVQSASDSVQRVFGWKPSELIGRNVSVLMPNPHRAAHDEYLEKYRKTGRTEHLNRARRFEAVRKDGTLFPLEVSVSRVDVAGQTAPLFVGVIRDLSETSRVVDHGTRTARRQAPAVGDATNRAHLLELLAEQTSALEAAHLRLRVTDRLASIGALAAGLGHDMNNVLLPVRAHLEAARSLTMLPEVRRHVEAVQFSVTYLQQLADGLHFLATNPEEESMDSGPTDLCTWWSHVGPLLVKAVPKHVKVDAAFPSGLPEIAMASQGLTQAVLNLIINAGEAISADRKRPAGQVRVWAQAAKDGATVTLGVSDNGPGMSAETQRRAFEMFYTTRSRGMGTGLGLPLVAKVVARARGTVQIETQRGRGTSVLIVIPVAAGKTLPADRPTAAITIPDGRATDFIRHLLEVSGVRVTPASDQPDTKIWILSPTAEALSRARTWRARYPDGRLILWGRPDSKSGRKWNPLHPLMIEDCGDIDSIGTVLRRAIARS